MKLHPDMPEPLFASLTLWERLLLGTGTLTVAIGTPVILYQLWSTL